jgi:hypothetical protein
MLSSKKIIAEILLTMSIASGQGVFEKRVAPVGSNETQAFRKQVKVALVVGVSKYPTASGFTALNYAAADATDLAAVLKQQGYLVRVLTDTDAMRGAIEQSLKDLGENVDEQQGTFLFYFSGHGFAQQGKNYLVPISASIGSLDRDGLSVDEVELLMAKSKAKRQLMLLDACRSDESSGTKGAAARSFSALQAAEGLRILNSTRIGKVSYESQDLQHGVFTAFLLKGLTGEAAGTDGLVTFSDLAGYVTDSVRRWAVDHQKSQVPFEAVGQKEASGDFLLAAVAGNRPSPAPPQIAPESNYESGFTPLFNGRDLSGWEGDPALWRAQNGMIIGSSDAHQIARNEYLISTRNYANFILRADIKLRNGNSGIQFRSDRLPNSMVSGYQADADEARYWGSLYEELTGRNFLADGWPKAQSVVHLRDWNTYEITCVGDHIQIRLNGVVTADIHDSRRLTGFIGFQLHKGPPMEVYFRNIRIKELP